ncbi:aldo/keto reductase [Pontibacter ruber]|uniref:Aldo/keto reductase n=1 Tax=Pontibacter ruber TaxID=1343895 RepID=A0ABW5D223_9BACT|nr:aldo/keto reductase [Pontibacter ruber]
MSAPEASNINRLILGTAQFGLNYGISNQRGQIPQEEVKAILAKATQAGITTLDTAAAYGNSEQRIGNALAEAGTDFRIISKYPPNRPDQSIKQAFEESLERLGVPKLYGYLLHSYSTYSSKPAVLEELQELKASGLVEKVGISLYHPQEAEELLSANAPIDIVQFPYSIFDRRFDEVLPKLQQQGIEAHVRSVYLQGLYFMQPDKLPQHLQPVAAKIAALQQLAQEYQLPLGAVCLGFALANPYISNAVIGVESLQTLLENIRFCVYTLPEQLLAALEQLKEENENIILPYKWPAS